jgi:potassium/hydrogen antiporter
MNDGQLILITGAFLAGGLIASFVAVQVRVPALVLFLGIGMLVGSDGTGWIAFNDYELARTVGVIALALILFEGGLASGFEEIRPVLRPAIILAILGTLVTAVIAGLVASWLFHFSALEGLLLGSILAGTDGAAVFALLRGSTLKRRPARTLEGEAGLNDPVAVLLVIGFIDWIQKTDYGIFDMLGLFVAEMGIGAVIGLLVGWLGVQAFRRAQMASSGLYPVASLTVAAIAFGLADVLHGSGFLAVYLAGLSLGSARIPARRTVAVFHDGLAWIAQIGMFFVLGLLVFPGELGGVAVEGTVLALVLVFVARPVAVFVATAFERFTVAEKLTLGWAGLRGAVPVVLATFPVIEGVPHSQEFFNIVFFAVLLSTLLQGSTFEALAERLGVTTATPALPRPLTETGTIRALLNVIVRGEEAIPPRGSTRIEAGDRLHLLIRQEVSESVIELTQFWRTGPIGTPVPPRRPVRSHRAVLTVRPRTPEDGNVARPSEIDGVEVVHHLRTRRDVPGALVLLADGRYAVSGPLIAVGPPRLLQRHIRRELHGSTSDTELAWWQEVAGALTSSSL